MKSTSMRNRRI